ncbi:MAG: hypothetical protein QM703_00770 [Gemmatales bacterium]
MSYRTLKRLMGETNLERKCRLLFGLATLLLITGSFLWYGWSTAGLAYEQAEMASRFAATQALVQAHVKRGLAPELGAMFDNIPATFIKPASRLETSISPRVPSDTKLECSEANSTKLKVGEAII